ncbi:MAG: hypothetical protein NC244_12510 [Alistipes senegalensis]|nr:hypothetical protein [Alistipes senegalensis]
MIYLKNIFVKKENIESTLYCDVVTNEGVKTLYISVSSEFSDYLTYERADAFVVGLLPWAMRNNQDIICEGIPITNELLYKLEHYLIPSLANSSNGQLNAIQIIANCCDPIENIGGVGTGITCGVDSFHSIYTHLNSKLSKYKLTHLVFMSIADSYKNSVEGYNCCTNNLLEQCEKVAKEIGIPLIVEHSNLRELFPTPPIHTFLRLFVVYSLQKLFGVYLWASGFPFFQFTLNDSNNIDSALYDLLSTTFISTSKLQILSEGGDKTRLEKTRIISKYNVAKKYLHVCTRSSKNCGICDKCRRTLCTLDAIGELENFTDCFNIDYYLKHRNKYISWIRSKYLEGDLFLQDVYEIIIKKDI